MMLIDFYKKINRPQFKLNFGFTLLEVLLVVAMFGILAGLSVPVFQVFQVSNDLSVAVQSVAQASRRAQVLARFMHSDSEWGVHIEAGRLVIFQGLDYAGRNTDWDEIFELNPDITPSGDQEIVFSKLSGLTNSNKSVVLTTVNNEQRTITIDIQGVVNY